MATEKIRYFVWRDGRPRWVPGPKARALGFKGTDLKDQAGLWLSRPRARAAADALNDALDAKVTGTPAPLAMVSRSAYDRSLAQLVDLFLARQKISLDENIAATAGKKKLARSSRLAYHAHGRLLKAWMGDVGAAAITPAMFEDFYADRIADSGVRSANAIMASAKAFYYYGEKKLRWDLRNPVVGVEMDEAEGRKVIWPREAIAAFVAVADYLGWPSLGDAVIEALLTTQRRNDVLPMRSTAIESGDLYRFVQSKTGQEAVVKAVPMLLDRVRAMRARKRARWPGSNAAMEWEIICEATGAPYPADGHFFAKRFSAVKLIAAGGTGAELAEAVQLLGVTIDQVASMPIARVPELAGLWFRDLRDTAITWLARAGCNRYEISKVTGLSLQSVDAVLEKHYLVLDDGFAISAGDKLAAHLGRSA